MNNDIISKYERIDKVVLEFSKNIEEYIDGMNEELNKLLKSVEALNGAWNDSNYDGFKESIQEKVSIINKYLSESKELKNYLEDISKKYNRILEILKSTKS